MWGNKWEDIQNEHDEIVKLISLYNDRISQGYYVEYSDELDIKWYYDLLSAHVINYLLDDTSLYLPQEVLSILNENVSKVMSYVEWYSNSGKKFVKPVDNSQKEKLNQQLINHCFSEYGKHFLSEICAQDIIYSGTLAKKISSILGSTTLGIEFAVKGEEQVYQQASEAYVSGKSILKTTKIKKLFDKEYTNKGALIRNREFKHCYFGAKISEKADFLDDTEEALNYKFDGNACQTAVFLINVKETESTGTGFKIGNGFALTCAHVVEGAKEIYANVICGDGYSGEEHDGFEVYDVGFGEVVYTNEKLDIALLKTEYCGAGFLSIETRNILPELGEEVVVLGYPLGYEMPQTNQFGPNISLYKGCVSSNQVSNGNSITFLDIDIKSGNSGSPVISTKTGKVIGIISGIKVGGKLLLNEKMPYMIPIQHFLELNK